MQTSHLITNISFGLALAGSILVIAVFSSCERVSVESSPRIETVSVLDSLDISPDFTWKTTKDLKFSFDAISNNPEYYTKIAIRNGNGDEILSGGAGKGIVFENKLSIATSQTKLSVVCTFPSGNTIEKMFDLTDSDLAFTFKEDELQQKSVKADLVDSDNDGVPDHLDDYPNNWHGAFTSFSPDGDNYGTLLFEDNWPSKGDYDFNDLVMQVGAVLVTKGNNKVFHLTLMLKVKAAGASYDNGFGIWFPEISKEDLSGAEVQKKIYEPKGIVETPAGDWAYVLPLVPDPVGIDIEDGQGDKVVVMAIDNIDDVILQEDPEGDWAFNTKLNGNNGIGKLIELRFWFKDLSEVQVNSLNCSDLNFFLTKNQERSTEIHLRNQSPTDKMNSSLFNTADDYSVPDDDAYYLSSGNLPWAIFIGADITWPLERIDVLQAFPQFEQWAISGGDDHPDWYENPAPDKVFE